MIVHEPPRDRAFAVSGCPVDLTQAIRDGDDVSMLLLGTRTPLEPFHLYLAVSLGRTEAVDALKRAGVRYHKRARLTCADQFARAAMDWDLDLMRAVHLADAEAARVGAHQALHDAIRSGLTDLAASLVRVGADFNFPDESGKNAIYYVVATGLLRLLPVMVDEGLHPDATVTNVRLLSHAVLAGDIPTTLALLERGSTPCATDVARALGVRHAESSAHLTRALVGNGIFGRNRLKTRCVEAFTLGGRVGEWVWANVCDNSAEPRPAFAEKSGHLADFRLFCSDLCLLLNAEGLDKWEWGADAPRLGTEYAVTACAYLARLDRKVQPCEMRPTWIAAVMLALLYTDGQDVFPSTASLEPFAARFVPGWRPKGGVNASMMALFKDMGWKAHVSVEEYDRFALLFT